MFNDLIKDAEDVINGLRQLRNATDDAESLEVIQKIGEVMVKMKSKMKKREEELNESFTITATPKKVLEELHYDGYKKATIDDAKDFIKRMNKNMNAFFDVWDNFMALFCKDKGIKCED